MVLQETQAMKEDWKRSVDQNRRYHAMLRSFARSMVFEKHGGVVPACLDDPDKHHKCPDCKASRKMRKEISDRMEELHLLCRFSFLGERDESGFYTSLPSTASLGWHDFSAYYMKSHEALARRFPQHDHPALDDQKWGE